MKRRATAVSVDVRRDLLARLEARVAEDATAARWVEPWLSQLRAGEPVTLPAYFLADVMPSVGCGVDRYRLDPSGDVERVA